MFYHAVLLHMRDVDDQFLARVKHYAARIRSELPYVRDYHFGPNQASRAAQYDWVVMATFDDEAAHELYQVSPVHQEMKAFMEPYFIDIVVADIETANGKMHHD